MIWNEHVETMSRAEMHALQSERLRDTVERVYQNVEFYRSKMQALGIEPGDIKTIDDIVKLPFTTKKDLRDNYPFKICAAPQSEFVRIHASSGTTGKPTAVPHTRKDLDMFAECVARSICCAGGSREDTIQVSYGYGLFTGGLGLHYGAEKLGAAAIPVSSGNTARQVQILQDYGSDIICCTPSYAMYIGETVRDKGIDPKTLRVRAGIFGAEQWTEEMRREIEKSLGIKAYDIYGLTETSGPGVSFECEEQTGMHINEDHFLAEIIDPDTGEVLPEGSKGELVFTSLTKEAFPLLRYRTRDICVLTRKECSCGRTLIKMCKPMGRSDDMLIIRGVNVFPSQIETVLLEQGYAPNYQIEVDRKNNTDTLDINVELTEEQFSDTVKGIQEKEAELAQAIKTILGINPKVHLVSPKTIARSEGKAVRVIDKRKLH